MNPNVPFNPSDRSPMFGTPTQNAPTPRPPVTDQGQQNQQGQAPRIMNTLQNQAPQRSGLLEGLPAFGQGRIRGYLRARAAPQAPAAPATAPVAIQSRPDVPPNRGLLNGGLLDRFKAPQTQPTWPTTPTPFSNRQTG